MSSSSSTIATQTRTGFSRSEFEKLKGQGDVQSLGFMAGATAIKKKTDVIQTLTTKKRKFGGIRIGKSQRYGSDPLDPDIDPSITEGQAQSALESSKRREAEIRRRMSAPGRGGLFLVGA